MKNLDAFLYILDKLKCNSIWYVIQCEKIYMRIAEQHEHHVLHSCKPYEFFFF